MRLLIPIFEAGLFRLAKTDELLARVAIMDAENTPVQNPKWQDKVDRYLTKAIGQMTKAADRLEKGHFASAICHYKMSWMFGSAGNQMSRQDWLWVSALRDHF